mgnify:CR=1 FL=1
MQITAKHSNESSDNIKKSTLSLKRVLYHENDDSDVF